MKTIFYLLTVVNLSFGSVLDDYLSKLHKEVQSQNPTFEGFDFKRGEKIFTSVHKGKKGEMVSCVTCHNNDLKQNGKNTFTGKIIEPLSPKANQSRFTDIAKIEKWLKRNFNDVYVREGTALEKGDVITYIIGKE
ncbi:MAG: DUF1924 domain-containing protein [Arcobacteraceae bacterium]